MYRYAHGQHHTHLAGPGDPELWPFVAVGTLRWCRLLAATLELCCGAVYTPALFLRAVLVGRQRLSRQQGRRMLREYALCLVLWGTVCAVVSVRGWWEPLVVCYLLPILLAGTLQTLNKYVEHMGLCGATALTSTRTVVERGRLSRAFSRSLLHVDYHGTHHRYAKVPYYNLPAATHYVYGRGESTVPVYSSYVSAVLEMLATLGNPRVGQQWLGNP